LLTEQVIVDTRSMMVGLERPRTIPGTVSPDTGEKIVGTGPTTAGAGAMTVDAGTPRTELDALRVATRSSAVELGRRQPALTQFLSFLGGRRATPGQGELSLMP
jgi:hypothetical protein